MSGGYPGYPEDIRGEAWPRTPQPVDESTVTTDYFGGDDPARVLGTVEIAWSNVEDEAVNYEPAKVFGVGPGQGNLDVGSHQKGDSSLPVPGGKDRS
jgi:hypothetical protein